MTYNQNILVYLIQIVSIYNAIQMGWNVKKISGNTYELTKKNINSSNDNLSNFIDVITKY